MKTMSEGKMRIPRKFERVNACVCFMFVLFVFFFKPSWMN